MKFISWNVNGLRACLKKGFLYFLKNINADIFAVSETKLGEGQLDLEIDSSYYQYWNYAERKGYSGTAVFSKIKPLNVFYDLDTGEHPKEGRVIALEFLDFYFVNCYTPNSKQDLSRLEYRCKWENDFRNYLLSLKKPVILCGDLNVAHKEIDLKNPKSNHRNAGFTDEEREKFTQLLNSGFVDAFRYLYPEKKDAYTWWSYLRQARSRNAGWRIDYFLVSNCLKEKIKEATIYNEVLGSDHCPVGIELFL